MPQLRGNEPILGLNRGARVWWWLRKLGTFWRKDPMDCGGYGLD
jgi:hypothetical protein